MQFQTIDQLKKCAKKPFMVNAGIIGCMHMDANHGVLG